MGSIPEASLAAQAAEARVLQGSKPPQASSPRSLAPQSAHASKRLLLSRAYDDLLASYLNPYPRPLPGLPFPWDKLPQASNTPRPSSCVMAGAGAALDPTLDEGRWYRLKILLQTWQRGLQVRQIPLSPEQEEVLTKAFDMRPGACLLCGQAFTSPRVASSRQYLEPDFCEPCAGRPYFHLAYRAGRRGPLEAVFCVESFLGLPEAFLLGSASEEKYGEEFRVATWGHYPLKAAEALTRAFRPPVFRYLERLEALAQ